MSWDLRRRRRRRPPTLVTFVTRRGCHLCDHAEPVVRQAAAAAGVRVEIRDVDTDPDYAFYSYQVPVVLLDGVEHAHYEIDAAQLRHALRG